MNNMRSNDEKNQQFDYGSKSKSEMAASESTVRQYEDGPPSYSHVTSERSFQPEHPQAFASTSSAFLPPLGPPPSQAFLPPSGFYPPPPVQNFQPYYPSAPASNFVDVKQHDRLLQGTFVIDPAINVPEAMLPKRKRDQDLKNLYLHTHDGDIKADVYLVGPGIMTAGQNVGSQGMFTRRPTTVDVITHDGNVDLTMNFDHEHPFTLHIKVHDGNISLVLPRSYIGGLIIKTRKADMKLSPAFAANLSTFSVARDKRVYFVGQGGHTSGSSIEIESHEEPIRIRYADEVWTDGRSGGRSGLLSKLLLGV